MNKIKKTAINAVKKAGKLALREYKNFNREEIKTKARHQIVTKVDLASEKIIINEVKKNFPTHQILSEETGRISGTSNYLWIIDPIDGTTNFSMHNPLWAISIAVAKIENKKTEIIFGIIYAPFLDELYVAEKGKGAKLNNKKIQISKVKEKDIFLNAFCHGYKLSDVKKIALYYYKQRLCGKKCFRFGAGSLELAFVAAGRIESAVIPGANSWDVAAGILLVKEAGGKATDFIGKPWQIDSKNIAASNGFVHKQVLKTIN
ncbi:MAG: inositol monophosphatase family protein [Patescibacteria group bacterium]|nr:inositol monophosphatase [Patescibacteria group bacterium]MBU1160272.1 inositol monophosphatase [Patescibacteria group bacterium]MBU1349878.1 inositol monophosphatase [Patescibacteria group bacterium]MBU1421216.1 inositol monophosphatase [Patescibacteria group bacterium]MBU1684076.1 inositol monophosphatase [Patescibacteria group bacterium]